MIHIKTTKREVPYDLGPGPWKLWGFRCSLMLSDDDDDDDDSQHFFSAVYL